MSNVLSGKAAVRQETRDAVLRAVDDLGYRLNAVARNLRTGRTGSITLALPDLSVDYFAHLARAVINEAEAWGWTVIVQQTHYARERELGILGGAGQHLSDGLIMQPHALAEDDIAAVASAHPTVLLGEHRPGLSIDQITMANEQAARTATEHLIDRGCRRIAAVGVNDVGGPHTAELLRLWGYQAALQAAGLPMPDELLAHASRWRVPDGVAAVDALLGARVAFDGLFCFNDSLAIGALAALRRRGLRVPDDVAVVGFDDVAGAAHSYPPLTTINPGGAEVARLAVEVLRQRIAGAEETPTQRHVATFHLVVRESA